MSRKLIQESPTKQNVNQKDGRPKARLVYENRRRCGGVCVCKLNMEVRWEAGHTAVICLRTVFERQVVTSNSATKKLNKHSRL